MLPSLRVVTWNARALLQATGAKASLKRQYLMKLKLNSSIVSLQEVRQYALQLREFVNGISDTVTIHSSFCGDTHEERVRGGVAILLPELGRLGGHPVHSRSVPLVAGRVLHVIVDAGDVQLDIFNVHNHDLSVEQVSMVVRVIRFAKGFAAADPTKRMVTVNGDFNFSSVEAVALHMPQAAVRRAARQHHAKAAVLGQALA